MGWKDQYRVMKIVPGIIIVPGIGEVDLSRNNLPLELVERVVATGCPYLKKIEIPENHFEEHINSEENKPNKKTRTRK